MSHDALWPAWLQRERSAASLGKVLLIHQGCEFEIAIPGSDNIKLKPKQGRVCVTVEDGFNVWFFQRGTH
jgi:hypothetical protein